MEGKRVEKSGAGAAQKQETLWQKLGRGTVLVGTRGGPFACTPVRLWSSRSSALLNPIIIGDFCYNNKKDPSSFPLVPYSHPKNHHHTTTSSCVSVRKLGAALWEFQHYLLLSKMHRGMHHNVSNGGASDHRLRRHQNHHHVRREKGLDLSRFLADPGPSSPDQPESADNLRRHIAASLIQHHRSIERSNRALQPVSPASYDSSMEVATYNPAGTPSSSLDFRGRIGESHYNIKTSTELLKVLNRIWSLEEQHSSNMSLIKVLKTELEHTHMRVKELLRDQQADRREIDDLMKQIAEDKIVRKSKEQDRLHATIQSLRVELEDERKLRKRSEGLHRRLARELSEVKSTLSNALKGMETERKSRKLLEDLCDEFAKGIKDYEQEVHALKQRFDKDSVGRADDDRLILHISESWLDERMQMKLESNPDLAENNTVVEKLGFEIETFLKAKRTGSSKNKKMLRERRASMESVPLNEAVSAPQDVGDDEDSAGSDSHCFELNKPSNSVSNIHDAVDDHVNEIVKSDKAKKKLAAPEITRDRNPSSMQVKFKGQMAWATASIGNEKSQLNTEEVQGEWKAVDISRKSEKCDHAEVDEVHGLNSNHMTDKLRSHISSSETRNLHLEKDAGEASSSLTAPRNVSPVRQWMSKLTNHKTDVSESSTSFRSKLLEARSKGYRSRLKIFKG
ncbi:hypothetical protein K2173_010392 [Erythroxylum novogranatense]|uniref:Intracellular protein transporter USO1-like protein n=1 Tax=Erythroxylum novogranatense TaxID=1862640 RepID=A0AAV8TDS1_9ROSI|nr:hypothetical protein K2173_010392 [Erythroxylum novogranatense]